MCYGLHIVPSRTTGGLRFELSAAPQGAGDPMLNADWGTWGELAAALRSVGTDEEIIERARKKALEKAEAVSIQNMCLTDEQLRKLRLKRG